MIKIKRNYFDKQTEGVLEIWERCFMLWKFNCLELPYLDNQKSISCIPEGKYLFTKEIQSNRGKVLRIHNVKNRSGILMHFGNYAGSINPRTKKPDTKGCILPGASLVDFDNDGYREVTSSKKSMDIIYDLLPDKGTIEIRS